MPRVMISQMGDLERERYLYTRMVQNPKSKFMGEKPWVPYFYAVIQTCIEKKIPIERVNELQYLIAVKQLDVDLFPKLNLGDIWSITIHDDLDLVTGSLHEAKIK